MTKPKRRTNKKVDTAAKKKNSASEGLLVRELLEMLRYHDLEALVLVDHVRGFTPVISVESFVVWRDDDRIWGAYTDDLIRGLDDHRAGGARFAVYLNAGLRPVTRR